MSEAPEDQPVILFEIATFDKDQNQYVKTWRVTEDMQDWCLEFLGQPHAESLIPKKIAAEIARDARMDDIMTVVHE